MKIRSILIAICALVLTTSFAAPQLRYALIFACASLLPAAVDTQPDDHKFILWQQFANGLIMLCLATVCSKDPGEILLWAGAFAVSSFLHWLSKGLCSGYRCRIVSIDPDDDEDKTHRIHEEH